MRRSMMAMVLALVAVACHREAQQPEHRHEAAPASAAPAGGHEHEHAAEAAASAPAPGAPAVRVKANEATTRGVANMTALVSGFDAEAATDASAFAALGDKLQAEMDAVIAGCTMTGADHDRLHEFLLPIFERLAVLKAGDLEASRRAHAELKAHLETYSTRFE